MNLDSPIMDTSTSNGLPRRYKRARSPNESLQLTRRTRPRKSDMPGVFRFLDLPPEIRLMVYPYCNLDIEKALSGLLPKSELSTPSVLLLNRKIYYEARAVLKRFERLTFRIPQEAVGLMEMICIPAFQRLQHIHIIVRHPDKGRMPLLWPDFVPYTGNTIAQLCQWITSFSRVWDIHGHNLKSFRLDLDDIRIFNHLRTCHSRCCLREHVRVVLRGLQRLRGVQDLQLTGNVLQFYDKEIEALRNALKQLPKPRLEGLPADVLAKIVALSAGRRCPIQRWKEFEAPIWKFLVKPETSGTIDDQNSETKTGLHTNATAIILAPSLLTSFRKAHDTFQMPEITSPSLLRVSRRVSGLCKDILGDQLFVFDQPFLPLAAYADPYYAYRTQSTSHMLSNISPFISDACLQNLRQVTLQYDVLFSRNWLWSIFIPALSKLWCQGHRLHCLTLRIVNADDSLNEKQTRSITKVFEPLAALRDVNIVRLEGPFRQSEKWKLEKMTIRRKR